MRGKLICGIVSILAWFAWACSPSAKKEGTGNSSIGVSWKLVTNFKGPADTFEARFRLFNRGEETLEDDGWALFFNMSPRAIHPNVKPQPAVLKHLNGDWYKMVPEKGFRLAPGDSVEVVYQGTEGIIKETDAPLGLYFVFYDKDGKESRISQVTDYRIEPFEEEQQRLRGPADKLRAASAEKNYLENLGLREVLPEKVLKPVPSPVLFRPAAGLLELKDGLAIVFEKGLESEAAFLKEKLEATAGIKSRLEATTGKKQEGRTGGSIYLGTDTTAVKGAEAYRLAIDNKVAVTGGGAAGVFYGIQTLLALSEPEDWKKKAGTLAIRKAYVEDAPRFGFRSMHLDVSRNFQEKETVLRIIDLLAFYKINHLLLYVTEDEGWRVEIDGLPELTSVGGKRGHVAGKEVAALHPAYGSGPVPGEPGKHGSGYYSRAEFIEILKYARQRHITIIPELNFPGHARAAIKAMEARYERLMKEGKKEAAEEYRLVDPDDKSEYLSAQFYTDNVVSVARASTYRFYEKVVDEYIRMYKEAGLTLQKFHTGGDEVAQGAWTGSPLAKKLLAANPDIKGPSNLHIYFFRKLLPLLKKRGLEVHGWEEVGLEKDKDGKYIPNPEFAGKGVVPYIWNNLYDLDLGYRLANAGYPVVLCNVTNFYFDMATSNDPKEPGLYWAGFVNTRANWEFAPYDFFKTTFTDAMGTPLDFSRVEPLKAEARKNIIGLECQLWSETVKGRDTLEYYILPKLLGFAESAWAPERSWEKIADPKGRKAVVDSEWNLFANRMALFELPRLRYMNGGYNYRVPVPGAIVDGGELKANTELPGLTIRYTADGSEPGPESARYDKPVKVSPGKVSLKTFDRTGRESRRIDLIVK